MSTRQGAAVEQLVNKRPKPTEKVRDYRSERAFNS